MKPQRGDGTFPRRTRAVGDSPGQRAGVDRAIRSTVAPSRPALSAPPGSVGTMASANDAPAGQESTLRLGRPELSFIRTRVTVRLRPQRPTSACGSGWKSAPFGSEKSGVRIPPRRPRHPPPSRGADHPGAPRGGSSPGGDTAVTWRSSRVRFSGPVPNTSRGGGTVDTPRSERGDPRGHASSTLALGTMGRTDQGRSVPFFQRPRLRRGEEGFAPSSRRKRRLPLEGRRAPATTFHYISPRLRRGEEGFAPSSRRKRRLPPPRVASLRP